MPIRSCSVMAFAAFVLSSMSLCQVATAEEKNEADLHLEKFAAQLTEAQSFATRIDFRTSVGLPGLSHDRAMSFELAVQRPRSFALVPRGKGSGPMVVANTKRVTHFLKDLNQYTDQEAPESLDAYSQSLEAMMLLPHGMGHLVMSLLAEHPDERLIADSSARKYLGLEQIDGIDCHHLRIIEESCDYDVWITAGPEPKLRRIRPDISKSFGEEEREAGFVVTMVLDFTEWDFRPEPKPGTFKFTPPAGAKRVDEFTAIHPEGVLPPIARAHPLIGKPAPKFELEGYEKQDTLKLEDVLGKQVVVLDFWAIFCPPCIEGLPKLQEVTKEFEGQDVVFRAVNLDDSREGIRKFLKDHDLHLPVLLDVKAKVAETYRVEGIPQTVLIGKDGRVHVVYEGLSPDFKVNLTRDIKALLAGEDLAAKTLAEATQEGDKPQETTDEPKEDGETPAEASPPDGESAQPPKRR